MVSKIKFHWRRGLFGNRWTEINGFKITITSFGAVAEELDNATGLPKLHGGEFKAFDTPDEATEWALALTGGVFADTPESR